MIQSPPRISRRRGFTLIEILIAVGIIVALTAIAIPAILLAKKKGTETRIRADLGLIETAIGYYKADFGGQYPQFADPLADQASNAAAVPGNGNWLDTDSFGVRGAALLCRALIGPGPANTSTNAGGGFPPNPGDDGYDGPGFRLRISVSGTNGNGTPILNGKHYGPYLDAAKFNIQYINPPGSNKAQYPQKYPVIFEGVGGDWSDPATGTLFAGSPVLYYPAAPGNPAVSLGYQNPLSASSNAASRFNGYDNQYLLDSTLGGSAFSTTSPFAVLAAGCGAPDFLLWTSGIDGQFGLLNGKSDDLTNFDLPKNLKK